MIILKVSSNHTFCSSVIFPEAILQAWCLHTEAKCPLGRFCGWTRFWAQIWGSVDKLLWAANVNYLKLCRSPFPINLCKTQEGIFFLSWKQNFPMLILLLKSRPMRGHLSTCSWGRVMEVTILLSFLSIFHISQSIFFFFFLAWLCQVRSWIGNCGWDQGVWSISCTKLLAWMRLWEAHAPWRQRHLVTGWQICTSLREWDALIIYLVSLEKTQALGLKLQGPWLQEPVLINISIANLWQLSACWAGSGGEALAVAPLSSDLPFAQCFFNSSVSS